MELHQIQEQAVSVARELLAVAGLQPGDILIVGCSSSEIGGGSIGHASNLELAQAAFEGIYQVVQEQGVYLAAQCCEHLNRAVILEREAALQYRIPRVNVVPQPKAGGGFATTAYGRFSHPVAVEHIQAQAGIDIGDTLIGMHLQEVAVPVRIATRQIGKAHVVCARTRLKYIGGPRAHYEETLQ